MAGADKPGDQPRDEPGDKPGGADSVSGTPSASNVYRFLFEQNPTPMWIYEVGTLRFLEVNDAAIRHYGMSTSLAF